MSKGEREIVCRGCHEKIPVGNNCPYCGTSVRSDRTLVIAIAIGLLVVGASLFDVSGLLFFAVIGLAIVGGAGYLLYDKRRRIDEATEEEEDLFGTTEETN